MNKQGSLAGWANVGDDLKYDWRNLISGLQSKVVLLQVLTPEQLKKRWEAAGRPTFGDFGFTWVHIEPSRETAPFGYEGTSFINDMKHRKMFQIEIGDPLLKLDWTDETQNYWERIACLVALFAGLKPLHEISHPPAPFPPTQPDTRRDKQGQRKRHRR